MDTLGSVIKAVLWGICVLVLIASIVLAGAVGWFAMEARVSPNVAVEAASALASVKPTVDTIQKLREYASQKQGEEDWIEKLRAENAIRKALELLDKKVEAYCNKAECIRWFDERYSFYTDISKRREEWANDLPAMLKRHANPSEIRSDNRIQLVRVACASFALVFLLYLFVAFTKFVRIGWRRLAALSALVVPPVFVAFAFSLREVDALYGNWDLSGTSVSAAMLIVVLYPFVVLPPLWVLNKKAGRSVLDALAFWREPRAT